MGRGEVGPERLLEDDPRPRREARGAEALDHPGVGARRQREVVEKARLAPELALGLAHDLAQRVVAVADVGGAQRRGEALPGGVRDRPVAAVLDRLAGEGRELVVDHLAARGADDDEALRHQARLGEMEHPRQELPPREVAGRPEEDDDVIVGDGRRLSDRRRLGGLDAHVHSLTITRQLYPFVRYSTPRPGPSSSLRRSGLRWTPWPRASAGTQPALRRWASARTTGRRTPCSRCRSLHRTFRL